jgi:hypothetical protein
MTYVEIMNARRALDVRLGGDQSEQEVIDVDGGSRIKRVRRPRLGDDGIRYQRCGGGYRIIRKLIGGN